jgi:hypothetical protein
LACFLGLAVDRPRAEGESHETQVVSSTCVARLSHWLSAHLQGQGQRPARSLCLGVGYRRCGKKGRALRIPHDGKCTERSSSHIPSTVGYRRSRPWRKQWRPLTRPCRQPFASGQASGSSFCCGLESCAFRRNCDAEGTPSAVH